MILSLAAASLAAFLLATCLNWLSLLPWRRTQNAHWTERARKFYPATVTITLGNWLIMLNVGCIWLLFRGQFLSQWYLPVMAAWFGIAASSYVLHRRIWPGATFKSWLSQFALGLIFSRMGLVILVVGGLLMPKDFGGRTWVVAGAVLIVLLCLIFGVTLAVLRALGLIYPAPLNVSELAQREAQRVGAKMNGAWVFHGSAAQAFAILPQNDMLFSDTLLRHLSPEELASICTHEAAHFTESRWTFVVRVASSLMLYPLIFIYPALEQFGLMGFGVIMASICALLFSYRRIGRKMEKRADASAASHSPDPAIYAQALEKIYELNHVPAVLPKRSSAIHGNLYDRMLAAGVTPAYERPKPPARFTWTIAFHYAVFIGLMVMLAAQQDRKNRQIEARDIPDSRENVRLNHEVLNAGASTNGIVR